MSLILVYERKRKWMSAAGRNRLRGEPYVTDWRSAARAKIFPVPKEEGKGVVRKSSEDGRNN
jgi:hypothetical protein